MNDKLLSQIDVVDKSIRRSKIILEMNFNDEENTKVLLYELIKSKNQIENIISEVMNAHPKLKEDVLLLRK